MNAAQCSMRKNDSLRVQAEVLQTFAPQQNLGAAESPLSAEAEAPQPQSHASLVRREAADCALQRALQRALQLARLLVAA